MRKAVLALLGLYILLMGCQKVVDADELLDTEEQVSIIGYISPHDTILKISVTKALPSIGTPIKANQDYAFPEEFLIKDAVVTLSNTEGNSVVLNYDNKTNTYITSASNLTILHGATYNLKVIVAEKEFNASCQIPKKLDTINEIIEFQQDEFGYELAVININFKDFADEDNYYILGGFINTTLKYENEEPFPYEYPIYFGDDEFLIDNINEGAELNGKTEISVDNEYYSDTKITLQVAHVEKALFENVKTTRTNDDVDGNPFVEYVIAPNNILEEGAIGVFSGYSVTEKVIDLKD
ncbi:DUF4249 family protein [Maribacter sp. M208]|uniref:DUF4249 family protein n=1 Tax=Maribacter huludaoensis TaxID=3030010 RepID=UPI0023ED7F04|nr:DUF4249 family protein [Maribacter huludaoensis]MDF4222428.1 DUF4249 family protein [Maribacter huludaoensis]